MRLVLNPLGAAALMSSIVALAALAVYTTHERPAPFRTTMPDSAPSPADPAPASATSAAMGGTTTVPPITAALLPPDLDQWMLDVQAPAQATRTLVTDPSAPNMEKRYLRAVITKVDPESFWLVQYLRTVDVDVPAAQNMVMRFIARSATRNTVNITFLRNGADHHSDLSQQLTLAPSWKTYSFPFTTSRTYLHKSVGGGAAICMHCGQQTGTVDMAALQVYPASMVTGAN